MQINLSRAEWSRVTRGPFSKAFAALGIASHTTLSFRRAQGLHLAPTGTVGPLAMISRSSPTTSDMIKLRILAGCANSRNQAKDLIAFCGTAQQIHDRYTGINAVLIWQRMTRSHDPAPVNASRVFVVGDGNGLYALARWNML